MSRTIYEVAKKANVSISTVSRVLNNSGYASEATRAKVIVATEELGYRQNRIAKSLRNQQSNFIGLLVPDIANEFFASLASSIELTLRHYGYNLFLCNTRESQEIENHYIESLLDNQVQGIIIVSAGRKPKPSLFKCTTPIVLVDRLGPELNKLNSIFIESENEKGGVLAAKAFLKRGAKRFVFLGDQRNMRAMSHRKKGFSETLFSHGVSETDYCEMMIPVSAVIARHEVKDFYEAFPFDAIFCATDNIALGAMRGLYDIGLEIPTDVQLIGFDGIQLGEFTVPGISTIRQDTHLMGKVSSESIVKMIRGDESRGTILLPVEFIARGTTK